MDKTMEIAVKETHSFISMELGQHLPVTQLVSFLEQTDVGSDHSLMEYCTTTLEMMEGICLSPAL
jgi:hypothetical protein